MSISQRTTKLILATCLAYLLAYFLNLSSEQFRLELSLS